MLFSEVYSAYFKAVAALITAAIDDQLNLPKMHQIIEEHGFGESMLTIPAAVQNGEWAVIDGDMRTIIRNKPTIPLSSLQKRWLKTLLQDPRLALFEVDASGLADVEPLFDAADIVYYDRCSDGDPYASPTYALHFKTILRAMQQKCPVFLAFHSRRNRLIRGHYFPYRLEYSTKDDKFRLEIAGSSRVKYVNLQQILECKIDEELHGEEILPPFRTERSVTFLLHDERNALNRVMLHFSDCRKETQRLDARSYQVQLKYEAQDEAEILIRILSFGPQIKVIEPISFVTKLKERLDMQIDAIS